MSRAVVWLQYTKKSTGEVRSPFPGCGGFLAAANHGKHDDFARFATHVQQNLGHEVQAPSTSSEDINLDALNQPQFHRTSQGTTGALYRDRNLILTGQTVGFEPVINFQDLQYVTSNWSLFT